MLPAFYILQVKTTHPKKSKITISYPGAMLNYIVQVITFIFYFHHNVVGVFENLFLIFR